MSLLLLLLACARCAGGVSGGAGTRALGRAAPAPLPLSRHRRLLAPRGGSAFDAGSARDAPRDVPARAAPAVAGNTHDGASRRLLVALPPPPAPASWRTNPALPGGAFCMLTAKVQLASDPLVNAFASGVAQTPLITALASLIGLDVTAVAVRQVTYPVMTSFVLNGTTTWNTVCTAVVEKVFADLLGLAAWAVKVPFEPVQSSTLTLITVRVRPRSAARHP